MNQSDFQEYEGQYYVSPTLSRDEQMSFIDRLRDIQSQSNAQIEAQTRALGTDVPVNLGGLTSGVGEGSYFQSRYQTPRMNAQVANLRTAAQQSALNQVLANELAKYKQQYYDAQRKYSKRQNNYATTPSGGYDFPAGEVLEESFAEQIPVAGQVTSSGNNTVFADGTDVVVYENDPVTGQPISGSGTVLRPTGQTAQGGTNPWASIFPWLTSGFSTNGGGGR